VPSALTGIWLGRRPYAEVLRLQRYLFEARKRGDVANLVLLLEHEPVITTGRGTHAEHLLASTEELARAGLALEAADRGGDVTLHAPGQLVAYPIVGLDEGRRDVRKYVQGLERAMARVAARFGVHAGPFASRVGLWADAAAPGHWTGPERAVAPVKIGAIGVRISRWTTMHGLALNLANDLSLYRHIVPCGIREYGVASIASLVGEAPEVRDTAEPAHAALARELGLSRGALWDKSAEVIEPWTGTDPKDFLGVAAAPPTIA
jgi:lipoyl(octanoyl) transferase